MKKISDYENEDALDLLADLIEPASEIFSDKELIKSFSSANKIAGVKKAIKDHKKAVIALLAAIDRTPAEEYRCNVFTLPVKLLEILNDKDLIDFFISQAQMAEQTLSGEPTENTEGEKE